MEVGPSVGLRHCWYVGGGSLFGVAIRTQDLAIPERAVPRDLADAASVGRSTIWRLESADGPLGGEHETVAKIVGALEAAGVEFLNDSRPGVRMRNPHVTLAATKPASASKAARKPGAKPRRPK